MMEDIAIVAAIFMAVLVYFQTIRLEYYKQLFEVADYYNIQLSNEIRQYNARVIKETKMFNERLPHLRAQIDEEMARLRKENGGV